MIKKFYRDYGPLVSTENDYRVRSPFKIRILHRAEPMRTLCHRENGPHWRHYFTLYGRTASHFHSEGFYSLYPLLRARKQEREIT
jgi:hypothetical protein